MIWIYFFSGNEIQKKNPQVVADKESAGDTFICYHCGYATRSKRHLSDHMKVHKNSKNVYSCYCCDFRTNSRILLTTHTRTHSSESAQFETIYIKEEDEDDYFSQKSFKRNLALDDHIVKRHPDFITAVSRKIHECAKCTYKTVITNYLKEHIIAKHPDMADNHTTSRCIYCNKTFAHKRSLDDHVIKVHPEFIASVSSKIHKCTHCTFKTTIATCMREHLVVKHPEMAGNRIFSRCIYCNNTFTSKLALDDHIVKKHPDFITAVSKKVHECTKCPYKTVITSHLKEHTLAKHPDITGTRVTSTCIYCNKTFVRKQTLDDHIVKSHPDFISSVSRKVHECTKCTYKTAITSYLKEHIMVNHPDITGDRVTSRCIYCDKTFAHKRTLDDHVIKIHPDFIASVSSKIHECTHCTYKTTVTKNEIPRKDQQVVADKVTDGASFICYHCKYIGKSKRQLIDHMEVHKNDKYYYDKYYCDFRTNSRISFTTHIRTHSSESTQFETITIKEQNMDDSFSQRNTMSINSETNLLSKISSKATTSVSAKVHECTKCTYKTVNTIHLKRHIKANHRNRVTSTCIYCNKTFVRKETLNDHIVKSHPDFIASVSKKVHECTKCSFKTISASNLKEHILAKHPDIGGNRVTITCIYCNKTLVRKETLEDHVVKIHPDFIASVSKKVHECTKCTFKTISTSNLKKHVLAKHPDIAGNRVTSTCIYCNKTFVRKETLDDHVVKRHPDFIASVSRKVHQCTKCTYKTVSINRLKEHMMINHPEIDGNRVTSTCIYCNKTFVHSRAAGRMIRISFFSVTKNETPRKDQQVVADKVTDGASFICYNCKYVGKSKRHLIDHMEVHKNNKYIYRCYYCDFRTNSGILFTTHIRTHSSESTQFQTIIIKEKNMDDSFSQRNTMSINSETNILSERSSKATRRHPGFIASVSRKIHECTKCTYKTVSTSHLKEHIFAKHPDIAVNREISRCIYCHKTFVRKEALDDHVVKRHPDFIASVSRKVHECTKCTFKTISSNNLKEHILAKHPDIAGHRVTSTCIYCNKTFVRKETLDDHIVRTHPDFIASVSRKVHECTRCTYKTVRTSNLKEHIMANHPDIAGNRTTKRCIYCNKTFLRKQTLDDHMLKAHPDFLASVGKKVHECTKCTYKTVSITNLKKHMVNHPDTPRNRTSRGIYCNCNKTFVREQTLDDHILKTHPDFITSVSRTVHECTKCTYKTVRASYLKEHILVNHPDIAGDRITKRCIYCNKTFVRKETLDDHIVKRHPHFIASVSRKVHECTKCTFKTISTSQLRRHMVTHSENHPGYRVVSTCIYCNKIFVRKETLDDHIVRTHPDFITSVSRKVLECTKCSFKTINTNKLKEHILAKHPDIAGNRVTSTCIYCNKTFVRKATRDDHIVKTHPDFIASVRRKVHECTRCTYKTVITNHLKQHMMINHPDIAGSRITNRCIYCYKTFIREQTLDDHIVKRHPDFIASVSRKVHQCTKCTYKTVIINHLKEHMMTNHPDIAGNRLTNRCIYCNKIFVRKRTLDDHIVKRHPDFITSVSRKVHECTKCTYRTVSINHLKEHITVNHPDIGDNRITNRCIYCSKTFLRKHTLDDHIIKIHPDLIASVSSKIHECAHCSYKTVMANVLKEHILAKHRDIPNNLITKRCVYCSKVFVGSESLDDHIVKRHPHFIASVSRKIHGCTKCTYKTVSTKLFKEHITVGDNEIFNRCVCCGKTFIHKQALDEHIIKNHPGYISSVTSKIHECIKCNFKTTVKRSIRGHICQNVVVTALIS
nr:unnamed protein product [Callosobruchus analis]